MGADVLASWGLWGIGVMYGLEAMAFPWPIEVPLWLSGRMLEEGTAGYWELVLVTWLGTSLGNALAFALARLGGRPLVESLSRRLRLQDQAARVEGWIDRYGIGAVVITRWVNWGFGLSLWLAGFSRLSPGRALGAMLLNNALWACAWVELGRRLIAALSLAGLPSWLVLLPGVIFLLAWGAWRLWQNVAQARSRRLHLWNRQ